MDSEQSTSRTTASVAVERGLAIFGFMALVAGGIWLALYFSQYVPSTVGRIGGAAVALTSVLNPSEATLAVVETTATTSLTAEEEFVATPVEPEETPVASVAPAKPTTPVTPSQGPSTSSTQELSPTASAPAVLTGLPDLTATILAVGYLTGTSTDSFVASATAPAGSRPAVKFSIQNAGTNIAVTGWRFTAAVPTTSAYVYTSATQQALNPGDRIEYTLGFDQASVGQNRSVSVNADAMQNISESLENNNGATAQITIQ